MNAPNQVKSTGQAARKKEDGMPESEGELDSRRISDILEAQRMSSFVPVDIDEDTQLKLIMEMQYQDSGANEDPELAAAIAASLEMMQLDDQAPKEENKKEEE